MKTETSTKFYVVALYNVGRILVANERKGDTKRPETEVIRTWFFKLICYIDTYYETEIRVRREI